MTDRDRGRGARPCYTGAVAILLALASAVAYGVSDYAGGRLSRRAAPVSIALLAEVGLLAVLLVVVPLVEHDPPTASGVGWGSVAGLAGGLGAFGLYEALSRGNMTIVAPITGVVAAIVPVVAGIALGERPGPIVVAGIALAVVAVGLVGGIVGVARAKPHVPTLVLAVAVGCAFGTLFIAYSRAGDDAGTWPLLGARLSATPLLAGALLVVARRGRVRRPDTALALSALAIGLMLGAASAFYLAASRRGLLSIVAVVVSLYPASTVGLAIGLDGERASRDQVAGMVLAAAAVTVITLAS